MSLTNDDKTRNAFAGFPARGFESHLLRHVGAALYRLLRFLYENRGALMPLLLLFRKKPRSALLSFVNALTTPRSLYQLSTSCEGSSPTSEKPKNSFHVSFIKSPVAMWFCWAYLYFHGRTTDTKTK